MSDEVYERLMGAAVMSLATDAIFLVDPATLTLIQANAAFGRLLGYSSEEVPGLPVERLAVSTSPGAATVADEIMRVGEISLGTRSLRRKDGSIVQADVRVGKTSAEERVVLCVVARDVGGDLAKDRSLRESEERYRKLAEAAFEGIALTEAGCVVEANAQLVALLGVTMEELVGRRVMEFVAPESRKLVESHVRAGSEALYEHFLLRKDGSKMPVEAQAKTIRLGERTLRVTAIRDISERRGLEEQLRLSQRMESIGRLAGGVAHDFNNLLTVILSVVSMLELDPRRPEESEDIAQIRTAAERATELTQQLLAFARRQIVEPQAVDLNAVVANMDRMLRRVIGEHIELVTVCSPGLSIVSADPGRVEQVLLNLVVNARDAMEAGGTLTIETRNATLDESYAEKHPEVTPGDYVSFSVSDTGVGMDAETMRQVFEPFFTTKEKGKGTGLGLATCYGIVKQSGGSIWVYSEVGKGTTFKVFLPRATRVDVVRPKAVQAAAAGGQELVLVVEDEPTVRRVAVRILQGWGYRVLETGDPEHALELFRETGGVDLLVTDVVMPKMSGKELTERLRREHPRLKILYTSGYAENTIVHHGIVDENVNFLGKPYVPDELVRAVRGALDRR